MKTTAGCLPGTTNCSSAEMKFLSIPTVLVFLAPLHYNVVKVGGFGISIGPNFDLIWAPVLLFVWPIDLLIVAYPNVCIVLLCD